MESAAHEAPLNVDQSQALEMIRLGLQLSQEAKRGPEDFVTVAVRSPFI
jgi:hypothetical protein